MSRSTYDQKVVIITNATTISGRNAAALLAERGARLVLNYPPSSTHNSEGPTTALRTHEEPHNGGKIVEAAIQHYRTVHALINNYSFQGLGPLNDIQNSTAWDFVLNSVLKGAFKAVKAIWPHFRKQGYGRIVFTGSKIEGYSTFEDVCRFALFGFAQTLAREGAKYDIKVNTIFPSDSYFVTGQPPHPNNLASSPDISTLAVFLANKDNGGTSGSTFTASASNVAKLRWERSKGIFLNPDVNFNATALATKWYDVDDFSEKDYPTSAMDFGKLLPKMQTLPGNEDVPFASFRGKVVIVTGGASGLGRCYSLAFANLGAFVVVNDLSDPGDVVKQILREGGDAIGVRSSVDNGAHIVQQALGKYGHVDILINNAGFVRDKSFVKMDDDLWDSILNVHLNGTYQMTKAVWPYFVRQRHGVIVNTTSTSGIYGNFGQANYSTAKLGILGLSEATARTGQDYNIRVNTIAPVASTGALAVALAGSNDKNAEPVFKPEYIVPVVLLLSSDSLNGDVNKTNGGLFEVGCGWQAASRLRPTSQVNLAPGCSTVLEELSKSWVDSSQVGPSTGSVSSTKYSHDVLQTIEKFKQTDLPQNDYTFTDQEVLLYNLSVGAKRSELQFLYENSKSFQPIPTFGVIPYFTTDVVYHHQDILPKFQAENSLLGEVYLEIFPTTIPTAGRLTSTRKLIEVLDKGNAAIGITGYTTRDAATEEDIFYNEIVFFMKGAGGFGGPRERRRDSPGSRVYTMPPEQPDIVDTFQTSEEQAALYRLTGDRIKMHIDPEFSGRGGHPIPILHGICSMGIAGRQLFLRYGPYRSIKVRLAGPVVPGQTLRTEMWKDKKEHDLVVFQVRVIETGKLCISGGGIRLRQPRALLTASKI